MEVVGLNRRKVECRRKLRGSYILMFPGNGSALLMKLTLVATKATDENDWRET
jgi:hypothetical protein